jgi:hypothetical protein
MTTNDIDPTDVPLSDDPRLFDHTYASREGPLPFFRVRERLSFGALRDRVVEEETLALERFDSMDQQSLTQSQYYDTDEAVLLVESAEPGSQTLGFIGAGLWDDNIETGLSALDDGNNWVVIVRPTVFRSLMDHVAYLVNEAPTHYDRPWADELGMSGLTFGEVDAVARLFQCATNADPYREEK